MEDEPLLPTIPASKTVTSPIRWRLLAIHLLLLAVIGSYCLHINRDAILNGLDGNYIHILVDQQALWNSVSTSLSLDPMRGPGSLSFPLNASLIFPYRLHTLFGDGTINPTVASVLFSFEMFIAVLFLGYALRMGNLVSLWGAWLAVTLIMPFYWKYILYPVIPMIPHLAEGIATSTLIAALLINPWPRSSNGNILVALVVTLLTLQLVLSNPLLAVIFAPMLLVYGLAALSFSWKSRPQRLRILLATVLVMATLGLSGTIQYLLGYAAYSAPAFFGDEYFKSQSTSYFASIFYHLEERNVGRPFFILAALGALFRALGNEKRGLAVVQLASAAGILVGGSLLVESPGWKGPAMLYFEVGFWTFYALYASYAVAVMLSFPWRFVCFLWEKAGVTPAINRLRTVGVWAVASSILLAPLYAAYLAKPIKRGPFVYPPRTSPLTRILKEEIALTPGAPFRGRLATFTGAADYPDGLDWFHLHALDSDLSWATNNDHRLVGPWYDGVPTLQEYGQTITPATYLLFSRTLSRPQDTQVRNLIIFSNPDPHILAAQGVRFVIADIPLSAGHERASFIKPEKGIRLHLWELPDPNLGHYSPTQVIVAANATEALRYLRDPHDLKQDVVLFSPVEEPLTPASGVSLRVLRDGVLSIQAQSGPSGASLLLLPFEYSACMQLDSKDARLLRANINQTALLFQGRLEAKLTLRYGPLLNGSCRLRDKQEFLTLAPLAAARAFPLMPAQSPCLKPLPNNNRRTGKLPFCEE